MNSNLVNRIGQFWKEMKVYNKTVIDLLLGQQQFVSDP